MGETMIPNQELEHILEHTTLAEVLSNPNKYFNMPRGTFKEVYPRMIDSKSDAVIYPGTAEVWVNKNIINSNYYMSPAGIYFPERKSGVIVVAFDNNVQFELENCFTSDQQYKNIFGYGDLLVKKSEEISINNKDELSMFVEKFYLVTKKAIGKYQEAIERYK